MAPTMTGPKALFCPTCRKVVLISDPDFPFCSDRCRVLDLGKWASDGYVISSPIHDPDLLDELEGLQNRATSATNQDRESGSSARSAPPRRGRNG
jgi:endogenous inhibitor of DNA gyrase (YacG/DUF329 family)